jgi:hypothetical protein
MKLPGGRRAPRPDLGSRERLLAWAQADDGTWLGGSAAALYLGGTRISWSELESADWDRDTEQLRVVEVGEWGQVRPTHQFALAEPGRLLELIRERVTSSVVLQRHEPVHGRRGVRVVGRRDPAGAGSSDVRWYFSYDDGIDPADPEVEARADAMLAAAKADLGLDTVDRTGPA